MRTHELEVLFILALKWVYKQRWSCSGEGLVWFNQAILPLRPLVLLQDTLWSPEVACILLQMWFAVGWPQVSSQQKHKDGVSQEPEGMKSLCWHNWPNHSIIIISKPSHSLLWGKSLIICQGGLSYAGSHLCLLKSALPWFINVEVEPFSLILSPVPSLQSGLFPV